MVKFIHELKNSELGMRITEKFYPTKKNDPEHRELLQEAMDRYKRCTCKKNPSQIKREIQVCKKFWKCYPHHYFIYDLYRNDVELSDDELRNFIPSFFWFYLYLPHYRSRKYILLTNNKIITDQIFGNLKIPAPKTLFYLVDGVLYSPEMERIAMDQIAPELINHGTEKIFVKPAEGSGGMGIVVFHKNDKDQYQTQQNLLLNREFLATIGKQGDYIIQAGLRQDPEISEIYPGSINTFRLYTENKDGKIRAVCAVLRFGRNLAQIDNQAAGGIMTSIDVSSGRLGNFAVNLRNEKMEEHPNTHFVFRTFKNSHWQEILKFVTESTGKIPFFTHLGWDIALTPEGPVAIEINCNPPTLVELTTGGLREAFGIEDPDYYWKNPGKRR